MFDYQACWKQATQQQPPGARRWACCLHLVICRAGQQVFRGLGGLVVLIALALPIFGATFWGLHVHTLHLLDEQVVAHEGGPDANVRFLDHRLQEWTRTLRQRSPTFQKLYDQIAQSRHPVYIGTFQQLNLWHRDRLVGQARMYHPDDPWTQFRASLMGQSSYGLIGLHLAYLQNDFNQAIRQWPTHQSTLQHLRHQETLAILGHEVAHMAHVAAREGHFFSLEGPCPDPPTGYPAYLGCSSHLENQIRGEAQLGTNPMYGYVGAAHRLVVHLFQHGQPHEAQKVYLETSGFPGSVPGISLPDDPPPTGL